MGWENAAAERPCVLALRASGPRRRSRLGNRGVGGRRTNGGWASWRSGLELGRQHGSRGGGATGRRLFAANSGGGGGARGVQRCGDSGGACQHQSHVLADSRQRWKHRHVHCRCVRADFPPLPDPAEWNLNCHRITVALRTCWRVVCQGNATDVSNAARLPYTVQHQRNRGEAGGSYRDQRRRGGHQRRRRRGISGDVNHRCALASVLHLTLHMPCTSVAHGAETSSPHAHLLTGCDCCRGRDHCGCGAQRARCHPRCRRRARQRVRCGAREEGAERVGHGCDGRDGPLLDQAAHCQPDPLASAGELHRLYISWHMVLLNLNQNAL